MSQKEHEVKEKVKEEGRKGWSAIRTCFRWRGLWLVARPKSRQLTTSQPYSILPRNQMEIVRASHLVEGSADRGVNVGDAGDACERGAGPSCRGCGWAEMGEVGRGGEKMVSEPFEGARCLSPDF